VVNCEINIHKSRTSCIYIDIDIDDLDIQYQMGNKIGKRSHSSFIKNTLYIPAYIHIHTYRYIHMNSLLSVYVSGCTQIHDKSYRTCMKKPRKLS
jgi:hypothetical protein